MTSFGKRNRIKTAAGQKRETIITEQKREIIIAGKKKENRRIYKCHLR